MESPAVPTTVTDIANAVVSITRSWYQRPERVRVAYCRALLITLCGDTPAAEFGPVRLRACRDAMAAGWIDRSVDGGLALRKALSRLEVNRRTNLIRRLFKIAASFELMSPSMLPALRTMEPVRRGAARETEPMRPVPETDFVTTLSKLSPTIRAMAIVQRCTGMRTSELVAMKVEQVDRATLPWLYVPATHKTARLGMERRIPLGPRARAALAPLLCVGEGFIFSPAREMARRAAELRAKRRSRVQPSHGQRRVESPKRKPGECYTVGSYSRAVKRAARTAGATPWRTYRLRHGCLTMVRRQEGLDGAQAVGGHASVDSTFVYAEVRHELAMEIAERLG